MIDASGGNGAGFEMGALTDLSPPDRDGAIAGDVVKPVRVRKTAPL
jgi:hypothetical protein